MFIEDYSSYSFFPSSYWSQFRGDTPLTLTNEEVENLCTLYRPIDIDEIKNIYLSLSRLIAFYVETNSMMFEKRCQFLSIKEAQKMPYVIAIAGSVAVGKTTTAAILRELLSRWPSNPKVALVTTDSFLYPNAILKERNILHKKGFPETYDLGALMKFMSALKAGKRDIEVPVYSHLLYDIKPNDFIYVDQPDILILEGINVLQPPKLSKKKGFLAFLSDFFDFTIYIDAEEKLIHQWYLNRFMQLREAAFGSQDSYFYQYSQLSETKACSLAQEIWKKNNLKNLRENILPTRSRAHLILCKGKDHFVKEVALRKM